MACMEAVSDMSTAAWASSSWHVTRNCWETAPETADEYLAAGVEQEEGGEKWRAGDAAKSARFFLRALEIYKSGLQHFPQSFDLAYNKARLQYDLTQQPRLMKEIPTTLQELLQLALTSHERALAISPENTDALFNTAQVLTSQADLITYRVSDAQKEDVLQVLKQAAELFNKCYELQEAQLAKQEKENTIADSASQSLGSEYNSTSAVAEQQWASLVEPITTDTLIDTVIAQAEVFTSMCGLIPGLSSSDLDQIKDHATRLFARHAHLLENDADRKSEIALSKANFTAAFLDAMLRYDRLDAYTYEGELSDAFSPLLGSSSVSPQACCDYADALLTFNATVTAIANETVLSPDDRSRLSHLQWKILSSALSNLQRAIALPSVQNLSSIHMRRGDCELLRHRMGESPIDYKPAAANSATLLKNAATYYRGSAAATWMEGIEEAAWEVMVKEAAANALLKSGNVKGLGSGITEKFATILGEMKDEGLLSGDSYQWLTT